MVVPLFYVLLNTICIYFFVLYYGLVEAIKIPSRMPFGFQNQTDLRQTHIVYGIYFDDHVAI